MMTKEGSTKIVTFITPGTEVLVLGCGHLSCIVKMHYFFKILLLYSQAKIRQTKYVLIMTKEGSTIILHNMTLGAGVLMLGCCHISQYSEYVVSFTLSIYSTLIAIVLRDFDAAFLYHG